MVEPRIWSMYAGGLARNPMKLLAPHAKWSSAQSRRKPVAFKNIGRGAHRIDDVGRPLALALHALLAGNLTFAGGIERSVANLDLTLSLVMADDQAIWRDAGPSQLERMRRRAVGEELFAAAKHDRPRWRAPTMQIGRASCRERVESAV